MRRVLTLALAVSALALACTPSTPPAPPAPPAPPPGQGPISPSELKGKLPVEELVRAGSASKALQEQLKSALTAAMEKGGPVGAIDVCATMAPQIAAGLSTDGLTVGRSSSRLRNPKNKAPDWLVPLLDKWSAAAPAQRFPYKHRLDDGRFVFATPLSMQPLCATCHGTAVADDVKAAIAARYPGDQATGFGPDDLRGAVWVELAAKTATP